MTRNYSENTRFTKEEQKFRRLLAEKKRVELERGLLIGLCLLLATVLGTMLILY